MEPIMPVSKIPKSKQAPEVLVIDFQDTGMSQFPATSKAAVKTWQAYLEDMATKGWKLQNTTNVNVGVQVRLLLIFYRV